jgi:hypothetical protein
MKITFQALVFSIFFFACNQSDIEIIEIKDNNQQIVEQYQQKRQV